MRTLPTLFGFGRSAKLFCYGTAWPSGFWLRLRFWCVCVTRGVDWVFLSVLGVPRTTQVRCLAKGRRIF